MGIAIGCSPLVLAKSFNAIKKPQACAAGWTLGGRDDG
jgi:hypothetical protein